MRILWDQVLTTQWSHHKNNQGVLISSLTAQACQRENGRMQSGCPDPQVTAQHSLGGWEHTQAQCHETAKRPRLGGCFLLKYSIKKTPTQMGIIILCVNNFKNTCLGFSAGTLTFRTSSPAVFKSSHVFPFSRWWAYQIGQGEVQVQNHLLNSKWMTSDDTLVKTTEEDALWRSPCEAYHRTS